MMNIFEKKVFKAHALGTFSISPAELADFRSLVDRLVESATPMEEAMRQLKIFSDQHLMQKTAR